MKRINKETISIILVAVLSIGLFTALFINSVKAEKAFDEAIAPYETAVNEAYAKYNELSALADKIENEIKTSDNVISNYAKYQTLKQVTIESIKAYSEYQEASETYATKYYELKR